MQTRSNHSERRYGSPLDNANIRLGKTLWAIKSNITVYSVIGPNASDIQFGKPFFGFVQGQSIDLIALGFAKIFEIEKNHELDSIPGIFRLLSESNLQVENKDALSKFLRKYHQRQTSDWRSDVEKVRKKQFEKYKKTIQKIKHVRDTAIAHLQKGVLLQDLPSVAVFESLLEVAFDSHSFINRTFLNITPHPILEDTQIQASLCSLLRQIGVANVVTEFPE